MTGAVLLSVGGLVLLLGGAEALVRSGTRLAARWGLSPTVVGLTVVSIGTSLPELAIGVDAVRSGNADLATGNVVGTNLVNVLFVLGLGALLRPLTVDRRTVRVDLPVMVAVTLLLVVLARDGRLSSLDGAILLVAAVVYTVVVYRSDRDGAAEGGAGTAGGGAHGGAAAGSALVVAVAVVLVVVGADLLVDGAVAAARTWGVDDAFVGLTVVAVGTSAPELATLLVSIARGSTGIAMGNLVGSGVYNIALVLGVTVLAAPGAAIGVAPDVVAADLVLLAAATVVAALALWTGARVSRAEGAALVLAYVGYLVWLVLTRV